MLPHAVQKSSRLRHAENLRGKVGLVSVAALSALAGLTDTIGFLATGDFVSFMSGNTTHLSVAVGERSWWTVLNILSWIGVFILGNALGVVVSWLTQRRAWPLLLSIGFLLALTAWWAEYRWAFLMAVTAMGMINSVVEEVNGLAIGVSYVTGALSRFGRGLGRWLIGQRKAGWRVQLVPWLGLLAGGVLGATLYHMIGTRAMAIASAFALILAILSIAIPRRWQLKFMPK